ncbi:MAG TPA: D-alanine--D-alanine ligase [Fimbriimonadaceae bacterium]|nr:D-alanine--D-alanine ligase [Fimbriimonadaceae bacterium]
MRKPVEIQTAFAERSQLEGRRSFYLVGIGGAGMSALAKMLVKRGFAVAGSDSTASPVTAELEVEGISVRIGHSGEGVSQGMAVVLTDAIDLETSPEVQRARALECPIFRRSQVLGWLLQSYRVIAITGTHGKTTTTGMTGAGLIAAGLDPLVVVGATVPEWGSPVREGKGEWAVVEACEAYDSFHDLDPHHIVLTNLELDHVDFHGNWENLRDSVVRFAKKRSGVLFYSASDSGACEVARLVGGEVMAYEAGKPRSLALPGDHNLENATAAVAVLESVGGEPAVGWEALSTFKGAERRLQVLRDGAITVIDDYAHHPTEIEASLRALRSAYGSRRLVVAFQPHLYSRTAPLVADFAAALSLADVVFITDIYPAREAPMPGVSSARIAELIKKPVHYVPNRHLLPREVLQVTSEGDVIVGMGAGNIAEFAPSFVRELERTGPKRVAVCYGGDSAEREVSLHSGLAIEAALKRKGYDAFLIDVSEVLLKSGDLRAFVGPERPDLAFLAVHGTNAEDGAIQGLFHLLHVPYTGSGLQSSAIAMDKDRTKQILLAKGIRVPVGQVVRAGGKCTLKAPVVVKPNAQGSTVGLSFVKHDSELAEALQKAWQYDESALVEEWIVGTEISVPVLGDQALPPVEIIPASGQYDFAAKYLPGATEEICPARISRALTAEVQQIALSAHNALGCSGASRTDMIIRGNEVFVLEVNTLPGMTGTSLLPNSAATAGISFDDLVDWIVQEALTRHGKKA